MTLPLFSEVRLITDRYKDDGLKIGDLGVIVEVYGDEAYEVDFSDEQGITIACLAVQKDEVELMRLPH